MNKVLGAVLGLVLGLVALEAHAVSTEEIDGNCLTPVEVRDWFNSQPPVEVQAGEVIQIEPEVAIAILKDTGFPHVDKVDGASYFEDGLGQVVLFPTIGGCLLATDAKGPAVDTAISGSKVNGYFRRMPKQMLMSIMRGV